MEYTEYGLRIGLGDLRAMLERAENEAQYHDKESCIYIKGGVNHTYLAKDKRRAAV